jgi:hypothetical protein
LSRRRSLTSLGVLFLSAVVLLLNEWTVASVLGLATLDASSRAAIWATCAVCLAWGALGIRMRGNASVRSLNLLVCSTVVSLAILELVLRTTPTVLGQSFVNGLYTRYSTKPGGIYFEDPNLKINFMIPSYKTTMYYNGYVWTHEADALGFRNRAVRIPADIVLLGDSFVYGHGVELEQTVGHFLEACSGASVMNLGRQGDSPLQEAYLLAEYAPLFRPRLVLYFFYDNDIRDLYVYLEPHQLRRFIEEPMDRLAYPARVPVDVALRMRDEANVRDGVLAGLRETLYLWKVVEWRRTLRRAQRLARDTASAVVDEQSLGWRYTEKAILHMRSVAQKHGAKFLIVPIIKIDERLRHILAAIARRHDLPILDTTHVTPAASLDLYLPGDGHFSERGARVMAGTVCRWLGAEGRRARRPGD